MTTYHDMMTCQGRMTRRHMMACHDTMAWHDVTAWYDSMTVWHTAWHDSMTRGCVFSFRRSNEESTRRSSSSVHEHYWPTTRPTTKQRRRSQTYQKRANAGYLRILSPLRRVPSRCITSKTTSTPSRRVGRSAPLCARQPRRV